METSKKRHTDDLFFFIQLRAEVQRACKASGFGLHESLLLLQVGRGIRQPRALADSLDKATASLSLLTNRLIKKGLLKKTKATRDARKIEFQLTAKGRDAVQRIEKAWLQTSPQ